jgi:hypothetical protein
VQHVGEHRGIERLPRVQRAPVARCERSATDGMEEREPATRGDHARQLGEARSRIREV